MSLSRTKNYTPFDVSWFNDPILPTISRNQSSRFGLITPRMNVKEHDNTVTATFDLPGMKREDVTMDLHNGYLTVSSGGSTSNTRKEAGYVVRERASGGFSRSLRLPNGTEPEDIKASMKNGVLTVSFPKSTAKHQPKRITIK